MESISVFEIIKLGIGPSSSHTMGPWQASRMFLNELRDQHLMVGVIEIYCELFGSLAKTGIGHGTDIAVIMGLSDEDFNSIDTDKISEKIQAIEIDQCINISPHKTIPFSKAQHLLFKKNESLPFHPNGMLFRAKIVDQQDYIQHFYSVGGGFVVKEYEQLQKTKVKTQYPCHSAQDLLDNCKKLNLKISELVLLNERAWRSEAETKQQALFLWNEIKLCIFRGVNKSGILPGGLLVRRRAHDINKRLLNGQKFDTVDQWIEGIRNGDHSFATVNKWVSVFALAVNEENASFGRIITAPTNGASGVIPAVLMYAFCFIPHFGEEEIVRFIVTAGEIGTFYKKRATISAAMGGCQAEIGVSSSMAAAGLTEALGGTREQVLQAAEIAMEHHLGMTCDPVGGLVQIPCIERNSMGAMKAITACNIALESDSSVARISLDNIIQTMWQTALDMNTKYKETSEGGLAKISVNVSEC
ncbi:MAG TPA: L-serine ammonia-lyase [Saprospiraceae bacterium]|nr:L-serine ammonia-lyase [Saprospiraceae bacterium]